MQRVRTTLQAYPDIKIVLGTGSADTEAAGRVIERYARGKAYFAAGFDLSPEILRLIKAQVIHLSVDQQPYAQGYYAVIELTMLRRYGIVPTNINTGAAIINANEADRLIELSREHYR
jgi:simple sugar transport system substrate-binding protein